MNSEQGYVIDTYAWIEYFAKTSKGAVARKYIENDLAIIPSVVLAELKYVLLRQITEKRETYDGLNARLQFAKEITVTINLDAAMAERAAEIKYEKRQNIRDWPLADSIVLATAETLGAKIVTGDPHFKGIKNVVFLG